MSRLKLRREQERRLADAAGPMAPADAMWHWFSTKFATDQFLTYAFEGAPESVPDAIAVTLDRAREIPYLTLRIREDRYGLHFPQWEHADVSPQQCIRHELSTPTWTGCLHEVSLLTRCQLDPQVATWRLHVFSPVLDVPGTAGPSTVLTLQISHTLGGGGRTGDLAGAMLGRETIPDPVDAGSSGSLMSGVAATLRARRERARDTQAGAIPAAKGLGPARSLNDRPSGTPVLRTLVRKKAHLPGPTPTIGALVAISEALSGYLRDRGEDASQLAAAIPVTKVGVAQSYNHLDVTTIGFHPDAPSRDEQIRLIVADFRDWHRRRQHPSFAVEAAAWGTIPAPVRRLGIRLLKTDAHPKLVPANTTVSSVDRGPADLRFGGCPVVFATAFPSLLPISSLAHGVHCLGDTVVVSVHASSPQVDVDDYVARLDAAIPH